MFNFQTLKLDKREDLDNTSSFVGIRKNENHEMVFRLPRGFNDFPDDDFEATKNLFFKMYRTFKKFERDNKSLQLDKQATGKDNIESGGNAYRFKDKEDTDVILYSKISIIENLLEAYKELSLDVIERKNSRNEELDYSKIDKYLHTATYLDDDVIYIDEMNLPRHFLNYQSATLIDLFCFILYELQNELEEETEERVKELANRFKAQHLSYDQSLFDEETFDSTITTLKDSLNDIDKITAYKDEDYWGLYEAIETFLYGELDMENTHEDGIFWGIDNFYQIWEDMCNTYAFSNFNVVYADTNIILNDKNIANNSFGGYRIFKKEKFKNPFFIEFRGKKRWMRPDLVRSHGEDEKFQDFIKLVNIVEHKFTSDFTVSPLVKENKYREICKRFCKELRRIKDIKKLPSRTPKGKINTFKNFSNEELKNLLNKGINLSSNIGIVILDWKYMDLSDFISENNKINNDISKQLCYEFSLKNSSVEKLNVESQFVIPYFYSKCDENKLEEKIGSFIDDGSLNKRILHNKIKVHKANFRVIQDVYLNHD